MKRRCSAVGRVSRRAITRSNRTVKRYYVVISRGDSKRALRADNARRWRYLTIPKRERGRGTWRREKKKENTNTSCAAGYSADKMLCRGGCRPPSLPYPPFPAGGEGGEINGWIRAAAFDVPYRRPGRGKGWRGVGSHFPRTSSRPIARFVN